MISKKYVTIILSVLLLIAAAVLAASQLFVDDTVSRGVPYSVGPTTAPYVTPPTTPPPSN